MPEAGNRVSIRVTVNGKSHEAEIEPRLLLVDFLREKLNLTGTHIGCDTSFCGACTVLLNDGGGSGEGRRARPDPAGLQRSLRPAMRLLHAGIFDVHVPSARPESESE